MATQRTQGSKESDVAKEIAVELKCPSCGKSVNVRIVKVTDEPAVPAEMHYEAVAVAPGKGGLFDGNQQKED